MGSGEWWGVVGSGVEGTEKAYTHGRINVSQTPDERKPHRPTGTRYRYTYTVAAKKPNKSRGRKEGARSSHCVGHVACMGNHHNREYITTVNETITTDNPTGRGGALFSEILT